MSPEKKQVFNERLKALHAKYTSQLPDKYTEIMAAWVTLKHNPEDSEAFDLFYRLVHTLKGTAATFGFTTQSDCCFDIQKILLNIKNETKNFSDEDNQVIEECLDTLKTNIDAPAEDIGQK